MVTMPMGQMDALDGGNVGLETRDVALPGCFFRASVEEECVLIIATRGSLYGVS